VNIDGIQKIGKTSILRLSCKNKFSTEVKKENDIRLKSYWTEHPGWISDFQVAQILQK
jgi:hypothetical protein